MIDHPPERGDDQAYRTVIFEAAVEILQAARGEMSDGREIVDVLDVGCNIGQWCKAFSDLGIEPTGIDAPYMRDKLLFNTNKRGHRFLGCDISSGFDLRDFTDGFDLVLCLEVAEHLPESSAEALIESLCMHGSIVVFSAALPGQGGWKHINEQPEHYWAEKFAKRMFSPVIEFRSALPAALPEYYKRMTMWTRV